MRAVVSSTVLFFVNKKSRVWRLHVHRYKCAVDFYRLNAVVDEYWSGGVDSRKDTKTHKCKLVVLFYCFENVMAY